MEQLFDILSTCISNPSFLSKASDVLKDFEASEGYAPALIIAISSSPSKQIQTLAGILLKNFITDHWEELSQNDKTKTKQEILTILFVNDPKLRNLTVILT